MNDDDDDDVDDDDDDDDDSNDIHKNRVKDLLESGGMHINNVMNCSRPSTSYGEKVFGGYSNVSYWQCNW